jgi:hypothetical protein
VNCIEIGFKWLELYWNCIGQKNRLVVMYCYCIVTILMTDYCIGIVLVSKSPYWSTLATTYHKKMDKQGKRCETSETYSFTACFKNNFSRKIGCRLEWDVWNSMDIPICTRVEQLQRFEEEYYNLHRFHQLYIVRKTGCPIPCSYTEYKLATQPSKYLWKPQRLKLRFSSPDVLKRTEQLLYPM